MPYFSINGNYMSCVYRFFTMFVGAFCYCLAVAVWRSVPCLVGSGAGVLVTLVLAQLRSFHLLCTITLIPFGRIVSSVSFSLGCAVFWLVFLFSFHIGLLVLFFQPLFLLFLLSLLLPSP